MKSLSLLTALVTLSAVAACTPGDGGSLGPAPSASPRPSASSAAPSPNAVATNSITIEVWFTRAGKVFPTKRTRPSTLETSKLALTELMAGPSTVEHSAGVSTSMFSHFTFAIAGITNGVATVSFEENFYSGGREVARMRQAQVVYTLTQFPTVSKVGFQSAGQPVAAPVGRADYADLLPVIVVMTPVIGQLVRSPGTISGTANVHESTVTVRILDRNGKEIAQRFTTATCGSGCRGEYTLNVPYQLCGEQPGTVEVFEVSSEDGTRVHTVAIPVVFGAC